MVRPTFTGRWSFVFLIATTMLSAAAPHRVLAANEASTTAVRRGPRLLKPSEHGVGRQIPDIAWTDLAGRSGRLSQLATRPRAIVLAATSTSCPLSRKFLPSLAAIEKSYREQGVAFLYFNPVAPDSPAEMRDAVKKQALIGPYVHDKLSTLAKTFGAASTTDVLVLDATRTVVYHGAVDDQYGLGYSLEAPRRRYLAEALDALLAGKAPETAATEAPGCPIDLEDAEAPPTTVTYHNRISRIIQQNCLECHREGGVGPFALDTVDEVVGRQATIRQAVQSEVMPPWFAAASDKDHGSVWRNDRSLSDRDKADLLAWLAGGRPEGDPADAPLPRAFPRRWNIGEPDAVVELPRPISIPATGVMAYQNVRVDVDYDEDRWVQALEIQPTDRGVVHHVLVFVQPRSGSDDEAADETADERRGFFAAYVPGNSYVLYPDGLAKRLPKKATLRFQLHYTPNGTATRDQTKLGMIFAKQPPRHEVRVTGIVDPRLNIPPGAARHEESASFRLPLEVQLLGMMPHMHVRGAAFRYEAQTPDGQLRTLLDIPRYDFNWQLSYRFAEPPTLPAGTNLKVTGWFDNSSANPANPDPTKTVRWGPQTYDEMLIGYIEYIVPGAKPGERLAEERSENTVRGFLNRDPAIGFKLLDRDASGQLSRDELGRILELIPQLQGNLQVLDRLIPALDKNGDGQLSLEEWQKVRELRRR